MAGIKVVDTCTTLHIRLDTIEIALVAARPPRTTMPFDRSTQQPNNRPMSAIIDAHTHIFPPEIIRDRSAILDQDDWFGLLYRAPRIKMASADTLVMSMHCAGIHQSIAFGFGFDDSGLCRACTQAITEAESCLARGARGIGELMPDGQGFGWTDWNLLDPLMELTKSYDVPVMIHVNEQIGHTYPGKGHYGAVDAFRLATHYPDNLIILPHWGGGLPFYEMMPEVRETLRNVYYDTAASIYLYDAAVFANVLNWAPSKILMGTDYPLLGQRRFLEHIRAANLDPDLADQLLGKNVQSILEQAWLHKRRA